MQKYVLDIFNILAVDRSAHLKKRPKIVFLGQYCIPNYSQNEGPICILSYALDQIQPKKPSFYSMLGLKQKCIRPKKSSAVNPPKTEAEKWSVSRRTLQSSVQKGLDTSKKQNHPDPTLIPTRNHFHKYDSKFPLRPISYNSGPSTSQGHKRLLEQLITDKKRKKSRKNGKR